MVALGYWSRDDHWFYMADQPPLGQYSLCHGVWETLPVYGLQHGRLVTLVDGYYLMDRIMDADYDEAGLDEPPEGVPPFDEAKVQSSSLYVLLDVGWRPLLK